MPLALGLLIACQTNAPSTILPALTLEPGAQRTANATNSARVNPPAFSPTLTAPGQPITLTVWSSEDWSTSAANSGRVLQDDLTAFKKIAPDLALNFVLKKPSGRGGLLDALTTTREVAPARLPDLITLDLAEIAIAADANLIQPLDHALAPEILNDQFLFARQNARAPNQWSGIAFTADVQHLAALSPAPRTWDEFTRQKSAWALPLGGDDALLIQYLGLGASLDANAPVDEFAAAQTLAFFKRARDLGLIAEASVALKSTDETWSALANGQAAFAQVSATRYWSERAKQPKLQFASIPTRDGRSVTLATGWAIAIVTSDPERIKASARWIEFILDKQRLGAWMRAAQRFPATRGALPIAIDSPDYANFLRNLMERAVTVDDASKRSDAWHTALNAVLKGQSTPEEAARTLAQR